MVGCYREGVELVLSGHRQMERNLKLTVAYDGTSYHGFQAQDGKGLPTIQSALEEAWSKLVGERVRMTSSGRTDAGVHARGQVVNFHTSSSSIPEDRVPYAMNSVLPEDIAVVGCEEMPHTFHARFDAIGKRYRYTILNQPFPSPIDRRYTLFVHNPLDVDSMALGAMHLVGRRDFVAVSGNNRELKDTVRTMSACSVRREGAYVWIDMKADGFLYHMARRIAGTLLAVGKGERGPDWVAEVIASRDRNQAGPTLPAHGLCLIEVYYA